MLPAPPTNLELFNVSLNEIDIRFTDLSAVSDGATFVAERSTNPSSGFVALTGTFIPFPGNTLWLTQDNGTFLAGGTYYYRVKARNSSGDSSYLTGSITVPPLPATPTKLELFNVSLNEIDIRFTDLTTVSDSASFVVERSMNPTSGFVGVTGTFQPFPGNTLWWIADTGSFVAGTTYYYRVKARNSSGDSSYLAGSIKVPLLPASPINFKADSYQNEIDLSWTNGSVNQDSIAVAVSTAAGGPFQKLAEIQGSYTNYAVTTLAPASTYYFRLTALNTSGSALSPVLTATTKSGGVQVADVSATLLVLVTYRDTQLPATGFDKLCNLSSSTSLLNIMAAWIKREANKYGAARPFNSFSCVSQQVAIPSIYWTADSISPLNEAGVVSYLETSSAVPSTIRTAILGAKSVIIISYYSGDANGNPGVSGPYSSKYSFNFVTPNLGVSTDYNPSFNDNAAVGTMAHEYMHTIGATDKYIDRTDPGACLIDPATGLPYPFQDIMCNLQPAGSTASSILAGNPVYVPLANLIAGRATAKEVGWLSGSVLLPPQNLRVVP